MARTRPAVLLVVLSSLFPLVGGIEPVHAYTVTGNATASAVGTPYENRTISDAESTTGLVSVTGTCSNATAQAWVSESHGVLALGDWADGTPTTSCISNSDGHGNVAYSETFRVESASLAPGTLVDISLCVRAAFRHGLTFGCGGSVNEGVTSTASTDVVFQYSGSQSAHGTYSERWNCYDGHSLTETGLFAAGGGSQTLTLTEVPVGGNVSLYLTISAGSVEQSFGAHDLGHIEISVVYGYSSPSPVQLVSTSTGRQCSPITNCTEENSNLWLPPASGTVAVGEPEAPRRALLLPPAPNPSVGQTSVSFELPVAESVELGVYDVVGAHVARLASGWTAAGSHTLAWDGRDDSGRAVQPGLYWLRMTTSSGRASRTIVMMR